jgi:hypothetical protein
VTSLSSRTAALIFAVACALTVDAQSVDSSNELASLDRRRNALNELLAASPERFVSESLALADAYSALAKRDSAMSGRGGARSHGMTLLSRAASATRFALKDPRRAIELYRRAGGAIERQHAAAAYAEEIADIQQFDLKDRAAAAATLKTLRDANAAMMQADQELGAWYRWKAQWIEAELAFLESGKSFSGTVDASALTGFIPQIYYGAGAQSVGAIRIDRSLNVYEPDAVPAAELEKKLMAVPPSHTAFLQNWIFAVRLPTPAAVQKWLTRNDPAGFWTASFLTVAAIGDRDFTEESAGGEGNVVQMLIRDKEGRPTAVALLAREYAKTHKIPAAAAEGRR